MGRWYPLVDVVGNRHHGTGSHGMHAMTKVRSTAHHHTQSPPSTTEARGAVPGLSTKVKPTRAKSSGQTEQAAAYQRGSMLGSTVLASPGQASTHPRMGAFDLLLREKSGSTDPVGTSSVMVVQHVDGAGTPMSTVNAACACSRKVLDAFQELRNAEASVDLGPNPMKADAWKLDFSKWPEKRDAVGKALDSLGALVPHLAQATTALQSHAPSRESMAGLVELSVLVSVLRKMLIEAGSQRIPVFPTWIGDLGSVINTGDRALHPHLRSWAMDAMQAGHATTAVCLCRLLEHVGAVERDSPQTREALLVAHLLSGHRMPALFLAVELADGDRNCPMGQLAVHLSNAGSAREAIETLPASVIDGLVGEEHALLREGLKTARAHPSSVGLPPETTPQQVMTLGRTLVPQALQDALAELSSKEAAYRFKIAEAVEQVDSQKKVVRDLASQKRMAMRAVLATTSAQDPVGDPLLQAALKRAEENEDQGKAVLQTLQDRVAQVQAEYWSAEPNAEALERMEELRQSLLSSGPMSADARRMAVASLCGNPEVFDYVPASTLMPALEEAIALGGGQSLGCVQKLVASEDRASADMENGILDMAAERQGEFSTRAIALHEMGHFTEDTNPVLIKVAREWVEGRATSPNPESLRVLVEGTIYGDDEVALPDHFIDPYVGKRYEEATEVLSMGLERMVSTESMVQFYVCDREHFLMTLGMLALARGEGVPT